MFRRALIPVILSLVIGVPGVLQAQEAFEDNVQSELSLVWGMAQGSFGDNIERPIPGMLFSFGGKSPGLPLVLRTELGWLSYGFDDYLEVRHPQSPGAGTPAISAVGIETGSSILMTHLVARFVPFRGIVTPYIGGLVGLKYIYTRVNVEGNALFDDDDLITFVDDDRFFTSTSFDSFAFSYGAGAGLDVQVFDGTLGMHHKRTTISMHMGVRYLFGTEADYLTENSIRPMTGGILFEQVESDTDMIIPELGLKVQM